MSTVLEPPRDANGIPILPGYRPPFTSETARQSRAKAEVNLRAERELYRKLGLKKQRPSKLIYKVREAIIRHAEASCLPNLPDCGQQHAKNAKLFNDIHMSLTGAAPSHKTAYKPHLQKSTMVEPVAPIEPVSHPAPEKVSAATPDSKDDCPFSNALV